MITKCACANCGQNIEFEAEFDGEKIPCPHCGVETLLLIPKASFVPPEKPRKKSPLIALTITAAVVMAILAFASWKFSKIQTASIVASPIETNAAVMTNSPAAALKPAPALTDQQRIDSLSAKPILMSAQERQSRDNILKALLDIASATSLGVNRQKYSDLLTSALSVFTFEKTKLSETRHEKYILCAEKAIDYYTQANNDWNDYFEYEWMREKEQTIMTRSRLLALKEDGVSVDFSRFKFTEGSTDMFYVPFKTSLSLFWEGADVYIAKMRADVQE